MAVKEKDEKYEAICEKLGFIPSEYNPELPDHEDDTYVNPFEVLEFEELIYLRDNGYLTKK